MLIVCVSARHCGDYRKGHPHDRLFYSFLYSLLQLLLDLQFPLLFRLHIFQPTTSSTMHHEPHSLPPSTGGSFLGNSKPNLFFLLRSKRFFLKNLKNGYQQAQATDERSRGRAGTEEELEGLDSTVGYTLIPRRKVTGIHTVAGGSSSRREMQSTRLSTC